LRASCLKNTNMNLSAASDPKNSRNVYYITSVLILACNIGFLFFYAHLMPIHADEAGFWFNWTNKSILHRFFNDNNASTGITPPWHGLTIYLSKISIYIFGKTGIGLRLPVILFGILSSWLLYVFTKKVTGETQGALLAANFLFLNPFFSHYSHELRGYSSLFFFSLCSYFCLFKIIQNKNNTRYFVFLFFSFLGCYLSNLASPIFFAVFLVTIFSLKSYKTSYSRKDDLVNLNYTSLFLFSFIAASFFAYFLFIFDALYLKIMKEYLGNQKPNIIAILDFFSTFLGYKYLDDPTSEIYRYPVFIYLASLISFLIGVIQSIRKNDFFGIYFFILLMVTSLFYAFSNSHVHTRSGVFLLPFIIIFQTTGIITLVKISLNIFIKNEKNSNGVYWILSLILIIYCSFLNFGKYNNLDLKSGNLYEKARYFLKENSGPNDLIISSIQETITAFYFGDLIRKNIKNIYKNNKMDNIFYISSRDKESFIPLKPYVSTPSSRMKNVIPIKQLSLLIRYHGNGKRKETAFIYKQRILKQSSFRIEKDDFFKMEFFNESYEFCEKNIKTNGLSLLCKNSNMACSSRSITAPFFLKDGYQLGIFKHSDDLGMGLRSMAFIIPTTISTSKDLFSKVTFKKNYFRLNYLSDYPEVLDSFKTNIKVFAPHLQRLSNNKNLVFCMLRNLFNDNSIINGAHFINFKLSSNKQFK
jgi:4-amino-4-deoxy-L-arabinose transferase-like glycosyltransferase